MMPKESFRIWKKVRPAFIAMMLVLVMAGSVVAVLAEDAGNSNSKEYTYTVRFRAGAKGIFVSDGGGEITDDGKTIVFKGLPYDGTRPNFQNYMVKVTDDKYYVKGIREAGMDNNTVGQAAPPVEQDIDYVVAYGIKGSSVAYTVNYVDTDGNEMAPSQTYYGNVGDSPVIAYLYIEGYFPQAYNLRRTLSENASANEFTFVYQPVVGNQTPTPTATPVPTQAPRVTATAVPTQAPANQGGTGTTPTPAPANQNADGTNPAAGNEETTPATEEISDEAPPQADLPASEDEVPDMIDIDDDSTPLADLPGAGGDSDASSSSSDGSSNISEIDDQETPQAGMSGGKIAGIVIAIAALIAAIIFGLRYYLFNKKNRKNS